MYYSEIKELDIANGIGCRTSIFVSGCRRHCPECFNESTWSFNAGKEFTTDTINYILKTMFKYYNDGLSILGGEPLELENQKDILTLIKTCKAKYPTRDIWMWTGFYWDELFDQTCRVFTSTLQEILKSIDILVDGPFDKNLKEIGLRFRGSSNQRIIDVKKSLETNQLILWHDDSIFDSHDWK